MRDIQQGDTAAMEALVHRYHERIYQFACRKLPDPHLAEDVAQECCLRVLYRADRYTYPQLFRPWVFAIAHNLCRDYYRSSHHRREAPIDEALARTMPGDSPSPDEAAIASLQREAVQEAINALSEEQRDVVTLRFYAELTVPEISQALSVPEGTVKSRLFYACKTLRARLLDADSEVAS